MKIALQPPVFWICEAPPALPAGSTTSAQATLDEMAKKCGPTFSGFYFVAEFSDIEAGKSVIQKVCGAGILRKPKGTSCGADVSPFSFNVLEHFGSGGTDLHLRAACCEWMQSETVVAQALEIELPAFAPAIPAGHKAAFFDPKDPKSDGMAKSVADWHQLEWGYDYEYDGCHPKAPETKCKKPWCLNTWWRTRTLKGDKYEEGPRQEASHGK